MTGSLLVGGYAAVVVAGDALPGLSGLAPKVLGALFVADTIRLRLRSDVSVAPPAAWLPWAGLALLIGLSWFWSADAEATVRVARHVGLEAVLLAALGGHPRREEVLRGAAAGALVGAAALAVQLFGVFAFASDLRGVRVSVGEGEPGLQARAAGAGLVLGISLLVSRTSRRVERAVIAGTVLAAVGVGLAGSRGAWLATFVALAAAARLGSPCVRRAVAAAALGLVVSIAGLSLRPDLRGPLPGVADADVEALTSGRDAIWRNAATMFLDHPLRGVGAGAVPAAYEPHRKRLEASGGPTSKPRRDAHSVYLEAAAGVGALGPLLLLLGMGAVAREARRDPRVLPVLVFGAASGLTLTTWEHTAWWLVLGWAAVAAAGQPERSSTA